MRGKDEDKSREKKRYNTRAARYLDKGRRTSPGQKIPLYLATPYEYYACMLEEQLKESVSCLELCSGMGEQSGTLIRSGRSITCTDISEISLSILRSNYWGCDNIKTVCCDMEKLPFEAESFDLVTCAGGLSYGDNRMVMGEINRLLKPGGYFVCIDSLNNNPIYKLNRYIHYIKNNRTKSTLNRMPSLAMIKNYEEIFELVECKYFGKFTWALAMVSWAVRPNILKRWSDTLDNEVKWKRLAFKFVMVARKRHD